DHEVTNFAEASGITGLPAAHPVATCAPAVPGGCREPEYLAAHPCEFQRAGEHVDQHGHRFAERFHRPGAVDEKRHDGVRAGCTRYGPKYVALVRCSDQLCQPAAVYVAGVVAALPA